MKKIAVFVNVEVPNSAASQIIYDLSSAFFFFSQVKVHKSGLTPYINTSAIGKSIIETSDTWRS